MPFPAGLPLGCLIPIDPPEPVLSRPTYLGPQGPAGSLGSRWLPPFVPLVRPAFLCPRLHNTFDTPCTPYTLPTSTLPTLPQLLLQLLHISSRSPLIYRTRWVAACLGCSLSTLPHELCRVRRVAVYLE
jgi:hypothetical protein